MQVRRERQQRCDQSIQRCGVALDDGFKLQPLTNAHDGHAVVADGAADDHDISGAGAVRANMNIVGDDADSRGVDVAAVSMTFFDDLRVSCHDLNTSDTGCGGHAVHDGSEVRQGEAFFQDESGAQIERGRAAHGEIIHRAVDCEVSDRAAGKEQWLDDIGIGRKREPARRRGQDRRIGHCLKRGIAKGGDKDVLDQLTRQLATAAVAENDRWVVPQRKRATPLREVGFGEGAHRMESSATKRP